MRSFRAVFLAYVLVGGVNVLITWFLSAGVELQEKEKGHGSDENEPLISGENDVGNILISKWKEKRSLLPKISRESRVVIVKLCFLFAVDSLASGLVPA